MTTAQLACDDMVRIANELDFAPTRDTANAILIRKTIAANTLSPPPKKAWRPCGGAGFFRKAGLERLLRDVHAAQFHPLPEKRQKLFTGRLMMGLEAVVEVTTAGPPSPRSELYINDHGDERPRRRRGKRLP
jgi:acyl-CoA dehydrogenase